MIKKYITLFMTALLVLIVSGCITRDNTDYLAEHYDFLRHSLGDFEVVNEGVSRIRVGDWGEHQESRTWTLQYERHDGEMRTFHLNNALSDNIVIFAKRIALQELSEYMSGFFDSAEISITQFDDLLISTPEANIAIEINTSHLRGWFGTPAISADIIDPHDGIKLYSITAQELMADWGATLSVRASSHGYENYMEAIEQLKTLLRALSDYLMIGQIDVDFFLHGVEPDYARDVDFLGVYNREADTFYID